MKARALGVAAAHAMVAPTMSSPDFTARIATAIALVLALTPGCSGSNKETAKDAGEPHDGGSETGAIVVPMRSYAPTMTAVYEEILKKTCAQPFCHLGAAGSTPLFSDKDSSYQALVNMLAAGTKCGDSGAVLVVPGDPDASLLYRKIEVPRPSDLCGDPMPGGGGPPLDDGGINQIKTWIEQGAQNN